MSNRLFTTSGAVAGPGTISRRGRLLPGLPRAATPAAALLRRWETLWVALLVLAVGLAHGINLFGYPYFHDDEGVYVSQAWAVVRLGKLDPYTYIYGHAPVGWFQIALWSLLTRGFYTFGTSVESGRVLMLLFQVGSTFLVYRIARSVTGSIAGATIAVLLFGFSAYGVYWHRRVMLDNIAAFWMLASLALLVTGPLTLRRVWLSAASLAIATLSKENAIVIMPALMWLVWHRSHPAIRWFGISIFGVATVSLISLWVLMAILKNELFPSGTLLGGSGEHVSLIETWQWQASREKDAGLLDFGSAFWSSVRTWMRDDPVLVLGGTFAAALGLLGVRWFRVPAILGLLTFLSWLFIARGGVVNDHFLVPLLPFLAINIAVVAAGALARGRRYAARARRAGSYAVSFGAVAVVVLAGLGTFASYRGFLGNPYRFKQFEGQSPRASLFWDSKQSLAAEQAMTWMQKNVLPNSVVMIDNAFLVDFREPRDGGAPFPRSHYYYKIDRDPAVSKGIFHDDWRTADYVITTPTMLTYAEIEKMPLVLDILRNSTVVTTFNTGGWLMEVRRVNKLQQIPAAADPMQNRTWESFKRNAIVQGRVTADTGAAWTAAEIQAATMLQAVQMNDRQTFDQLWGWTRQYLQVRGDYLLASGWGRRADSSEGVTLNNSLTAADQNAALALLFAARRWNAPQYQAEALPLLGDIWERETAEISSRRVVIGGDWATGEEGRPTMVRPASFAPAAYRIFADADPSRPWTVLIDSSYDLLDQIVQSPAITGGGALPEWVMVTPGTDTPFRVEPGFVASPDSGAGRGDETSWQVALDWLWFADGRAQYILQALPQGRAILQGNQAGGSAMPALADAGPALAAEMATGDPAVAQRAFAPWVAGRLREGGQAVYWGDKRSAVDQLWGWNATALMNGGLANLWANERVIDWEKVLAR